MKRLIIRQCVPLLFLFLSTAARLPAGDYSVALTGEERAWLKEHQTVRVSNMQDFAPFNFNTEGQPAGFGIDYMDVIGRMLGIELEYVTGPSFGDFLTMAQHREIDVFLGLVKQEERLGYLDFTTPFLRNANVIVSRIDNEYDSLELLSGKTVAVLIGTVRQESLETEYPDIKIRLYPSYKEAILAVGTGDIDAVIGGQSAVSYFIREYFFENLSISGIIPSENPALEEICIGVRNDWPLLTSSIQKAMDVFPKEAYSKIQKSWFYIENEVPVESSRTDSEFIQIVTAIFLGIVLINVAGLWIFKKLNLDIRRLKWHSIRATSLIALAVFVCLAAVVAFLCVGRVEYNYKDDIMRSLEVVLRTADKSLSTMIAFNLEILTQRVDGEAFQTLAENLLLNENRDYADRRAMERYIADTFPWNDRIFYLVIDTNFQVAASSLEGLEESIPEFLEEKKIEFTRAFSGRPQFLTPLEVPGLGGKPIPHGFLLIPIENERKGVIAVLAASYNPRNLASKITEDFYFDNTAETYAFDNSGRMFTESRFTDQLVTLGILTPGASSILQMEIRNPGVNLLKGEKPLSTIENREFTRMAQNALIGIDGWALEEYRNYLGVPVFGVWLWNDVYRYGLATEVEAEEIMKRFTLLREIIILALAFTMMLAVGTTLMSLVVSGKANEALNLSNADLQKRVEKRTADLTASNELFHGAIEAITYPFCVVDVATRQIVMANRAAREKGAEIGKSCYSVFNHCDKPCGRCGFECSMSEVVRTKSPATVEHVRKDSSGAERYLKVFMYPILNEHGEVFRIIEYGIDITDRKFAEKQIKENEKRLESLLEATPDSLIIVDNEMRIIRINHETESLFGYDRSELMNQPFEILFPKNVTESRAWDSLKAYASKAKSLESFETYAQGKTRRQFPVEISLGSLYTSEGIRMMFSVRDITRRKADEVHLREQMYELELFNKLTIGREEKMIELKSEVNELLKRLNLPEKYSIAAEE